MLTSVTLVGLSLGLNVPTPAQNTGCTAEESIDQMKKEAAALSAPATLSPRSMAHELAGTKSSSTPAASGSQGTTPGQPVPTYVRPTEKTKLHNYLFDAF